MKKKKAPSAKKAGTRPRGRPTKRTPKIIAAILEGLSMGTPLTLICEPEAMPAPNTVWDWQQKDRAFSDAIAHARASGFDRIAWDALRIADTPVIGVEITVKPTGDEVRKADMLGHRRLQVESRLKLLAKWDPKRYGEKITQEHSGPDGGPIRTEGEYRMTPEDEEFVKRVARTRANLEAEMSIQPQG